MKPAARAQTTVNEDDEQMLWFLGYCPIILAYYLAKNEDIYHDCGPHHHLDVTRGWSQSYDMSRRLVTYKLLSCRL